MLGDEILKQRIGLNLSCSELAHLTNVRDDIIVRLESHDRKFISQENFDKLNKILKLDNFKDYIYKDTNKILGEMLKEARIKKGYRQIDVAILAGYKGISKISQLEHGYYSKINEQTFLKLKDILSLDRNEFEPYISKNHTTRGNIKTINRNLIKKLIYEKRINLKLTKEELGKLSNVNLRSIYQIENIDDNNSYVSTLLKLMHTLNFTKEEILLCIPDLKEEDLNDYKVKIK